jgi:hypothetical protein
MNAYPRLSATFDLAPRGMRRAQAAEEIVYSARHLRTLLADDSIAGDLAVAGFPTANIQPLLGALNDLLDAAPRVARAWKEREKRHPSRHGPTRRARNLTLYRLSCVFDYFYAQGSDAAKQATKHVLAAKREFLKIALTAAGIPCPRFEPFRADTAARSRLARFPLQQCKLCWEDGVAARVARRREPTGTVRRRLARIEQTVRSVRVPAPSAPDNGAAFTCLIQRVAPLLEEYSKLAEVVATRTHHRWRHSPSSMHPAPGKFEAQTP